MCEYEDNLKSKSVLFLFFLQDLGYLSYGIFTWDSRSSIFLIVSLRQDFSLQPCSDLYLFCLELVWSSVYLVSTCRTGLNSSIVSISSFNFYFCAWSSSTSVLSSLLAFCSSKISCYLAVSAILSSLINR